MLNQAIQIYIWNAGTLQTFDSKIYVKCLIRLIFKAVNTILQKSLDICTHKNDLLLTVEETIG